MTTTCRRVIASRSGAPLAVVVLVVALLVTSSGCTTYGDVSDEAYQYAQALYSITNRELEEKLDPVSEQIEAARDAGELPQHEAAWLLDIIESARNGDWDTAQAKARRIMEDQVR